MKVKDLKKQAPIYTKIFLTNSILQQYHFSFKHTFFRKFKTWEIFSKIAKLRWFLRKRHFRLKLRGIMYVWQKILNFWTAAQKIFNIGNFWNRQINQLQPNVLFIYPLKKSEKQRFSDIFRGHGKGTLRLRLNGLGVCEQENLK